MPALKTVNVNVESNDFKLWSLVNNRAGFSEFLRTNARSRWHLWPPQIHEVNREAKKKKRIQARNLGKTITAADEFISAHLCYRGGEKGISLVGARSQPTLQFVFEQLLAYQFERNKFLNHFLLPGDRGIDRRNYEIRLNDGSLIKGRIQGKDSQGWNTVHPNIISWFEEVQLISEEGVAEIQGMLTGDLDVLATGVPNGVRSSWGYQMDNNSKLGFEGNRLTRLDDPRTTEADIEGWKLSYGGETSAVYRQKVMGEWGSDARMTFDISRFIPDLPFKEDEIAKLPPYYYSREIAGTEYNRDMLPDRLAIRDDFPKSATKIYIHADHGITGSPTTGYVSYFDDSKDMHCWRQYMRFLLYGMQTQAQVDVFHYIAETLKKNTKINPVIGLDTTGQGGQAVASFIEEIGHPIVWANLAEKVKFGTRLETDEEYAERLKKENIWGNQARQLVEMEATLKQVGMDILRQQLYSGSIRLINQKELWKQFENTTDYDTPSGRERKYVVDYSLDGLQEYDHDLQAFEVLAAMIHRDLSEPLKEPVPEMWSEPYDVGWSSW